MGRTTTTNSTSEEDYLDPDFDPFKLTKPQLRSILASYGVTDLPPTNVRKEALVELFVENITNKMDELLRKKSRVKPSDKGIAFLDEKSQPSPRRVSPRGSRRRGRQPNAAAQKEDGRDLLSRSKDRSYSRSPLRQSTKSPPNRRSISRSPTARGRPLKSPSRKRATKRSTSPNKKAVAATNRRLSSSGSPRRGSSRVRSESPLSALQKVLPKYSDSPKAATVKLHDRLEYIANANRLIGATKIIERSVSPSKTKKLSRKPLIALSKLSMAPKMLKWGGFAVYYVTMLIFAVLLGGYVRYKVFFDLPYCDNSVALSRYLPKTMQLSILESLSEMCIPCPMHGKCTNGQLTCNDGFIARANWIAFGYDCAPDRRKLSLVDDLTVRIRTLLSERAGQALCGQIDELGRVLTEAQLGKLVRDRYPQAEWNTAQFDSLFKMALDDIGKNAQTMGLEVAHNPMYFLCIGIVDNL